jgi:hypothetical protein
MDTFKNIFKNNISGVYHWLYGSCDDYMNNNESIITNQILNKSACIKKFYNNQNHKYYDINDPDFIWPIIQHGASNPNLTVYGIFIKKCENNDFRKKHFEECSPLEDINSYIKNTFLSFTIADNYVDVLNYKNPINKFLYSITSGISTDSYSTNNVNFNPIIIRSYQGLIRDNYVEETSYSFHENSKSTTSSENTIIIGSFFLWIQNSQLYYERHYQKITDVFSSIGGIGSAVFTVMQIINYFINNFIILLDTQDLILNVKNKNYIYEKLVKRPSIINFIGQMDFNTKIKNKKIHKSPSILLKK